MPPPEDSYQHKDNQMNATAIRNNALREAADLVRKHPGENFVGIGGNMGWRLLSQDGLADAVLALVTEPDEASADAPDAGTRALEALAGLREALSAGIRTEDGAHRVLLSDGTVVEGRAAEEWHALMKEIIAVADDVLATAETLWRAYPGASWPDEPVEADFAGSFHTLGQARQKCEQTRRGGFADFVINERTREVWKRPVGGDWALLNVKAVAP